MTKKLLCNVYISLKMTQTQGAPDHGDYAYNEAIISLADEQVMHWGEHYKWFFLGLEHESHSGRSFEFKVCFYKVLDSVAPFLANPPPLLILMSVMLTNQPIYKLYLECTNVRNSFAQSFKGHRLCADLR